VAAFEGKEERREGASISYIGRCEKKNGSSNCRGQGEVSADGERGERVAIPLDRKKEGGFAAV